MKVGDLVRCPECAQPNESGLVVEPKREDNRIGVMWADSENPNWIDFEPVDILEVISHG